MNAWKYPRESLKTHWLLEISSRQFFGGSDQVHLSKQQPAPQQHLSLNTLAELGHWPSISEGPALQMFCQQNLHI